MKKQSSTTSKTGKTKKMAKKPLNRSAAGKKMPLVSIITPVYNGAAFLDATIHSVLGQTYPNWELIVVDDGSTDATPDILKSFSSEKIKTITFLHSRGAATARNRGIREAKGTFISFLDADDLWQPDKLERQLAFMQETGAAFSYTGYVFADRRGEPKGRVVRVPKKITYSQALKNTTIWTSTVMFDRRKVGKRDMKMPNTPSEDTATWRKILKKIDAAYGLDEVMAIRKYQAPTTAIAYLRELVRGRK